LNDAPVADTTGLISRFNSMHAKMPPRLPREKARALAANHFARKELYLQALAAQPAPVYLLDSGQLRLRAAQFKSVFQSRLPAFSFYYAVKSNNHPDVAAILLEEDFGMDVSSGLELDMALDLGAGDIIFSGPGKTEQELRLAASHSDRVVVLIDSFGELQRLETIAAALDATIRCGVRLTVDPNGLWRKFGIHINMLPDFLEKAGSSGHIRVQGLQFHSSWNLSPGPQTAFIRKLGEVLADMAEPLRSQIEFIDIGGGYWPEQGEWLQFAGTPYGAVEKSLGREAGADNGYYWYPAAAIDDFGQQISAAVKAFILPACNCRICLEPGRWICNDAMHLLISVVDKKAADLVITDAGTNAVGWERFETDYCPVLNLTRPALEERPCYILGSLCTPHDVWGYAYWGEAIHPGDTLMIPNQGAYTYSLRQQFIKPLPAVATI
jgi:diaminopimelate decarboxylase